MKEKKKNIDFFSNAYHLFILQSSTIAILLIKTIYFLPKALEQLQQKQQIPPPQPRHQEPSIHQL